MEECTSFIMAFIKLTRLFSSHSGTSGSLRFCGFKHNGKYYHMVRMGFGFTNAVNVFQYCIDNTLESIPEASAYIDDIYILCNNHSDNLRSIRTTLAKLHRDGWRVRIDKCEFLQQEVKQLGRVVNGMVLKFQNTSAKY